MIGTVERARGRWREILPQLGIETRFLTNKHGPCPLCGGVDRFRYDDRNGEGTYYCNQCGAGVGVILVRKRNNWDHATACKAIDEIIGKASPTPAPRSQKSPDRAADKINALIRQACAPQIVNDYLFNRGISVTSAALLGHSRCPFFDQDDFVGNFPAVIAPIMSPDNTVVSVQRIYVADSIPRGQRKKIMTPVGTINGAAVRLHDAVDGALGVAEGIETALACYEMHGIPTWAALSENGIQTFVAPEGVNSITVFGDNDSNFVGQDAAYSLARRLRRDGKAVQVKIPPQPDTDWNDVLNQQVRP